MERFPATLKRLILRLFSLDTSGFSSVVLERGVADDISEFARTAHPKEFVALLGGKIRDKTLVIDSMVYQPFQSSHNTSVMTSPKPSGANIVGSIHSHPSSNVTPSSADITFFNKRGAVHFIIGRPYADSNIACYDLYGNKIKFEII
jgi:proteasome lid subunit RPN8/RPN11